MTQACVNFYEASWSLYFHLFLQVEIRMNNLKNVISKLLFILLKAQ